jgi:hypothetical protein
MIQDRRVWKRLAVVTAWLALLFPQEGRADGPTGQVVRGTGTPVDVAAVQAAVSAGGRVTLVGDFDFGATGQVVIGRDVHLSGRGRATIRGGTVSFVSPLPPPAGAPPAQPGPAITIENLTFDGARVTPIRIAYARSVEIHHLTIRNVVPFPSPAIPIPGSFVQLGITVSTQAYSPAIVPGAITGRVRIHHNELDMTGPVPESTVCVGVQVFRGWGVDVEMSHNTVANCSRNGIEALDNSLDGAGAGRIRIRHNRVRSTVVGSPWPVPFRPNGIVAGWFFFPTFALDPLRNPPHEIEENDIAVGGGALAGIFVNTGGAVIEENDIAVTGAGAMGITLASSYGLVEENRVTGDGAFALRVAPFFPAAPSVVADGNTLLCNDLGGFVAARADVGVAGNQNTVVGRWSTFLDTGTGNGWVTSACR